MPLQHSRPQLHSSILANPRKAGFGLVESSGAVSEQLKHLVDRIYGLSSPKGDAAPRPSMVRYKAVEESHKARLFEARINLKMATAPVSMHLPVGWRNSVFTQIDDLLSEENWDFDSHLPNMQSYQSFLRFTIHEDVRVLPAIGVSNSGNILAAFFASAAVVSFEFLLNDRCRLIYHPKEGNALMVDRKTKGTKVHLAELGLTLSAVRHENS